MNPKKLLLPFVLALAGSVFGQRLFEVGKIYQLGDLSLKAKDEILMDFLPASIFPSLLDSVFVEINSEAFSPRKPLDQVCPYSHGARMCKKGLAFLDTAAFNPGQNRLRIIMKDTSGQRDTSFKSIYYAVPPAVQIIAPETTSNFIGDSISLKVTCTDVEGWCRFSGDPFHSGKQEFDTTIGFSTEVVPTAFFAVTVLDSFKLSAWKSLTWKKAPGCPVTVNGISLPKDECPISAGPIAYDSSKYKSPIENNGWRVFSQKDTAGVFQIFIRKIPDPAEQVTEFPENGSASIISESGQTIAFSDSKAFLIDTTGIVREVWANLAYLTYQGDWYCRFANFVWKLDMSKPLPNSIQVRSRAKTTRKNFKFYQVDGRRINQSK